MSGGVWLGAHKMCAPEEPCFDPCGRGLEACFGTKPIFIKFSNSVSLEGFNGGKERNATDEFSTGGPAAALQNRRITGGSPAECAVAPGGRGVNLTELKKN